MRKLLFPPVVPNSLPAFGKKSVLKYFFKPSSVNSIEQIKHVQITIVKLDTNRSILDPKEYPFDIVFKNRNEIKKDEARGFWYVELPASIFPTSDIPYKIQIRLGETDIVGMGEPQLGAVLKNLDSMSEWSIVTMVLPITLPDYGIQSFSERETNEINSNGYVFEGYYKSKDPDKKETLTSYRYNIYLGRKEDDKSTWQLLSSSGEKFVGSNNKVNMSHTFPVILEEGGRFVVTLTIKTRNLYVDTKIYDVYCLSNPALEMFNAIDIAPNAEQAQMDLSIRAKQILLQPTKGSTVEYIVDEPSHETYPELRGTHAKIKGTILDKGNFQFESESGVWVCQLKAFFSDIKNSVKEISEDPTVELFKHVVYATDSEYFIKLKIGAMKINLAYPTSDNKNPKPEWEYRFVIRKEILTMEQKRESVILSQNKIIRRKEINPKQEYYFYIKEEQGNLVVDVKETYLSSNPKI